jgi:hypothetical protein
VWIKADIKKPPARLLAVLFVLRVLRSCEAEMNTATPEDCFDIYVF